MRAPALGGVFHVRIVEYGGTSIFKKNANKKCQHAR